MYTKEELITKQQFEIEDYKVKLAENQKTIKEITGMFIAIGQPLNDNILMFNNKQLAWAIEVFELIKTLN